MSIYRNTKTAVLMNSCAAWDSYKYEPKSWTKAVDLKAGDSLDFEGKLGNYKISSCASYALENNECPIEAYNRAVENGHETHWIIATGSCLTAWDMPKEKKVYVDRETLYFFEGHFFKIEPTHNRNLKLVKVEKEIS